MRLVAVIDHFVGGRMMIGGVFHMRGKIVRLLVDLHVDWNTVEAFQPAFDFREQRKDIRGLLHRLRGVNKQVAQMLSRVWIFQTVH